MSNARNLVDGQFPSGVAIKHCTVSNVTATGTTQATATTLLGVDVVVVPYGSGAGVILPSGAGLQLIIINTSGGAINVYPPSGGIIDTLAANIPFSLPTGGKIMFIATSSTQYYTLNATYA